MDQIRSLAQVCLDRSIAKDTRDETARFRFPRNRQTQSTRFVHRARRQIRLCNCQRSRLPTPRSQYVSPPLVIPVAANLLSTRFRKASFATHRSITVQQIERRAVHITGSTSLFCQQNKNASVIHTCGESNKSARDPAN